MLLEFGGRNFCSFKEGFLISFDLGSNCPESIANGNKISNLICIKGSNSSGKTNILKALAFLKSFCTNSFSQKPEEKLLVDSFFFNDEPTYLYCLFEKNNIQYKYEVELTDEKIISEVLYKKNKREVLFFDRKENTLEYATKEIKASFKSISLRNNASLISTAHQLQVGELEDVYEFFHYMISNVQYHGLAQEIADLNFISSVLYTGKDNLDFIISALRVFEPNLETIDFAVKEIDGKTIYEPLFGFNVDGNTKFLSFIHQSSGIKSLYKQLPLYRMILVLGGVLILDEFDINLHPHILPFLTDLFSDPEINKYDAQMIFTSHNSEIMDRMTKYRTYLVNKENGASYAYRLDEFTNEIVRNDRPISTIYNQAKLGGVPTQHWNLKEIWPQN